MDNFISIVLWRIMSPLHDAMKEAILKTASLSETLLTQPRRIRKGLKGDMSPVTAADLACQVLILEVLAKHVPEHRIYAEETSHPLKNRKMEQMVGELVEEALERPVSNGELRETIDYRGGNGEDAWFIDPIDGTRGFLIGRRYAIAVANMNRGKIRASWLAVPGTEESIPGVTNHLFYARRGEGAWRCGLDNSPDEALPKNPSQNNGRLCITASRGEKSVDLPSTVDQSRWNLRFLALDSEAKYAAIAAGIADLYPRKPSRRFGSFYCWDHAAGSLLVEETGGVVTDLAGAPLNWEMGERLTQNSGIFVSSTPRHHRELLPLFSGHVRHLL